MLHLATLAEFGMVDGKDLATAFAWLQLAEELSYGEARTQIQARIAAASQALDPKGRARATKLVDGHRASLRKRWPMPK